MKARNKSVNEYQDTQNEKKEKNKSRGRERDEKQQNKSTSAVRSVQLICYVNVQCWYFFLLVVLFLLLLLFLSCLNRKNENEITHRRMIETDTALICGIFF